MKNYVPDFITELKIRGIVVSADPAVGTEVDYPTASHLYAWVEQKVRNEMVREGRRTGSCECCGAEME
jgi:hypothetical protein